MDAPNARPPKTHDLTPNCPFRSATAVGLSPDGLWLRIRGDARGVEAGDTVLLSSGLGPRPWTVRAISHVDDCRWWVFVTRSEESAHG